MRNDKFACVLLRPKFKECMKFGFCHVFLRPIRFSVSDQCVFLSSREEFNVFQDKK